MTLNYIFTVVLSAFLLFVVQPMVGKAVLPWFGGSAAVWSTLLFFFQFILLLGYIYSFLITTYLDRRKQIYAHTVVLVISIIVLFLGVFGDGTPLLPTKNITALQSSLPVIRIILVLTTSVGLPYFALSTTGPLTQSWYARDIPERTPYVLYSMSNAGSFFALVAYPFSIEPFLPIKTQAWLWCGLYLLFVLSMGFLSLRHGSNHLMSTSLTDDNQTAGSREVSRKAQNKVTSRGTIWKYKELSAEEREFADRLGKAAQWFLLSMSTSILLAAVTNQITQDIAPIPLLWILPLGLYLFSFVISFGVEKQKLRLFVPFLGIATLAVVYGLSQGNTLPLIVQIGIFATAFFLAALVCHGELARLRPEPQLLTAFYLTIAMGSVFGTVLVSIVAPMVFDNYWEFHFGFLLCWILILGVIYLDRRSFFHIKRRTVALYLMLIPPVTLLLFTLQYISTFQRTSLISSRNFYGALRLQEISNIGDWDPFYILSHGSTIHGLQYKPSQLRKIPIAYFNEKSGVGRLLTAINSDSQGKRVGVLGLGVGTLASYGREQDVYRFYEINPEIVALAEGKEGYLNYLSSSSASIVIILGDARLSLEKELTSGNKQTYDVLVLDVFSGDAIPVHLLTQESFNLYLEHLKADGVIAAHISTTHINLAPLLARYAEVLSMNAILIEDDAIGYPCCQSRWILMSREASILQLPIIADVGRSLDPPSPKIRIWTDNYSNPLQILY